MPRRLIDADLAEHAASVQPGRHLERRQVGTLVLEVLLPLLALLGLADTAFAACSNPTAAAGSLNYCHPCADLVAAGEVVMTSPTAS
jgi:hypothetical protein